VSSLVSSNRLTGWPTPNLIMQGLLAVPVPTSQGAFSAFRRLAIK
jgi:hypothetical protein